jgi:hypothetical protein
MIAFGDPWYLDNIGGVDNEACDETSPCRYFLWALMNSRVKDSELSQFIFNFLYLYFLNQSIR